MRLIPIEVDRALDAGVKNISELYEWRDKEHWSVEPFEEFERSYCHGVCADEFMDVPYNELNRTEGGVCIADSALRCKYRRKKYERAN